VTYKIVEDQNMNKPGLCSKSSIFTSGSQNPHTHRNLLFYFPHKNLIKSYY